jgi:Na+/proline symporter
MIASAASTIRMRIRYRLTPDDYYDASRVRSKKQRLLRRSAILLICIILGALWMRQSGLRGAFAFALLVVFILLSEFAGARLGRFYFKRALRQGAKDSSGTEFTVDILEEGIQPLGTSALDKWSDFSHYSELPSAFVLLGKDSIEAIFPKRAFDADGIRNFRRILKSRVARF